MIDVAILLKNLFFACFVQQQSFIPLSGLLRFVIFSRERSPKALMARLSSPPPVSVSVQPGSSCAQADDTRVETVPMSSKHVSSVQTTALGAQPSIMRPALTAVPRGSASHARMNQEITDNVDHHEAALPSQTVSAAVSPGSLNARSMSESLSSIADLCSAGSFNQLECTYPIVLFSNFSFIFTALCFFL